MLELTLPDQGFFTPLSRPGGHFLPGPVLRGRGEFSRASLLLGTVCGTAVRTRSASPPHPIVHRPAPDLEAALMTLPVPFPR